MFTLCVFIQWNVWNNDNFELFNQLYISYLLLFAIYFLFTYEYVKENMNKKTLDKIIYKASCLVALFCTNNWHK